MQPRIETLPEKKLIGKQVLMSISEDKTRELWQNFMPRLKDISSTVGSELYSVEIYPPRFFDAFDPKVIFEKWAAVEVSNLDAVPEGMIVLTLPTGLYAVFLHKGTAKEAAVTYQYIFTSWLPNAPFLLDHRPHLAVMGVRYKNDDPSSEEELWIPVQHKEDAGK
jgi:AraC family transcriptional regulator